MCHHAHAHHRYFYHLHYHNHHNHSCHKHHISAPGARNITSCNVSQGFTKHETVISSSVWWFNTIYIIIADSNTSHVHILNPSSSWALPESDFSTPTTSWVLSWLDSSIPSASWVLPGSNSSTLSISSASWVHLVSGSPTLLTSWVLCMTSSSLSTLL